MLDDNNICGGCGNSQPSTPPVVTPPECTDPCTECDSAVPDQCVIYTGVNHPCLNITTGMPLGMAFNLLLNSYLELITPVFNSIGPYCIGATIPALPTTSLNGFTGTWEPSVIDNTETGVYVFTPDDPRYCSVSLTVEIQPLIIPTFDQVGPYCEQSIIEAIPTTSLNGITGTWSPEINNLETTLYTFTPVGQCAQVTTMTIEIIPQIVPVFDDSIFTGVGEFFGFFEQNENTELLPTEDSNGLLGTWNIAQIDTSQIGTQTYIFTPNDDQGDCLSDFKMEIRIYDPENPPGD